MRRSPILGTVSAAAILMTLLPGPADAQNAQNAQDVRSLPRLSIDLSETTVSGLSSGAFMAHQLHVAYSDLFHGAAIIAGGPFYCAEGSATKATDKCMQPKILGGASADQSMQAIRRYAEQGLVADPANLADDPVFLFSGTEDSVVNPVTMQALRALYQDLNVATITYTGDVPAGHAFVVDQAANPCGANEDPFINDCDRDQAGNLLKALYGSDLAAPDGAQDGSLIAFDQREFIPTPRDFSMADSGYAYIPTACEDGERCSVHVALHGCEQSSEVLGTDYVTGTGYIPWADDNDIVVLFPQAVSRTDGLLGGVLNPYGCWNWWGYGGDDLYATRAGAQVGAIVGMVERIASGR